MSEYQIKHKIPKYTGPHADLRYDRRIPDAYILEIRRAVSHMCIETQAAFLFMMFRGWQGLKAYHANPDKYDDRFEDTAEAWEQDSLKVWTALAKEAETPALFMAYKSHDHETVARTYQRAAQAVFGGA